MLEKILPEKFYKIIMDKVNLKCVNEIRLRADKPVLLNINGKMYFLNENGISTNFEGSLYSSKIMIEDVIFRASECSIYSVNEQIKKGYIITDEGVRIGIGGNIIEENGKIKTMSNFSSVNIRIPHTIKNCSLTAFPFISTKNGILNTLIVSPPGCGKTTFLRDFVYQLSYRKLPYSILLLDERGELDCGINSNYTDKIAFCTKKIGFENGIRSLAPDVIITDEIGQEEDVEALDYASSCGVNIIASTHADSIEMILNKPLLHNVVKNKLFKRYVLLSKRNGPGTFEGIYNENFSRIYNAYN